MAVDRRLCLMETCECVIRQSPAGQLACSPMTFGDQISVTARISSWIACYQGEDRHDKIKGKEIIYPDILKPVLFIHIAPCGSNLLIESCTHFKVNETISKVAAHLQKMYQLVYLFLHDNE